MRPPNPHPRETERLRVLRGYKILDSLTEKAYDDLAELASAVCNTPMAFVTLVDQDRLWFKAKVGLEVNEVPRDIGFCAHTILLEKGNDELFIVPDMKEDERFHDNPLVTAEPKIRFYAGAPLIAENGLNIGSLCVLDTAPRAFPERNQRALAALARQVMSLLELRSKLASVVQLSEELDKSQQATLHSMNSKMEFISKISHEFRTPLSGVIGMVDLLKRTHLNREQTEYAEIIDLSSQTLLKIMTQMIEASESEA